MSSTELLPLFPSATHPALPAAAQILSTLRNLTAPGKGNDLRPEERTALVGVSALIGCERVQSKDLVESSAQKASSVSPAHFRSALQHARRILRSLPAESTSPTRRSRRSPASSTSAKPDGPSSSRTSEAGPSTAHEPTDGASAVAVDALNPFQTPRKRYKHTSGIDVSGLMRSGSARTPTKGAHEPATSSPLRHSVTPSRLRDRQRPAADLERTDDGGLERTPTKRVKVGLKKGVDLEAQVEELEEADSDINPESDAAREGGSRSDGRRENDMSAFFALRPGGEGGSTPVLDRRKRGVDVEDGTVGQRSVRKRAEGVVQENRVRDRERRDWRYVDEVWGGVAHEEAHLELLRKILGSKAAGGVAETELEAILLARVPLPVT